MPKRPDVVAWDSDVLICWIADEQRADQRETDGVAEIAKMVVANRLRLVMSDAIDHEVLIERMCEEAHEKLERLTSGRVVQVIPADQRVKRLARELRSHYLDLHKQDGKGKLTGFDAQHLATAIHYKIPVFYTFDDGNKKSGGQRSRSLLSLDGNVAGNHLAVKRPLAEQLSLHLKAPET